MEGMRFELESVRLDYVNLIRSLMSQGETTAPRGMRTKELVAPTIVVHDLTDNLPVYTGRGVNNAIAAVEACQLLGFSDPDFTVRVAPNMAQFREADGRFHGAYGPRLVWQWEYILARLRKDPDTRQAVASIWNPMQDVAADVKDLPCTLSLQFLIRKNKLVLICTMRSNDVWWGLTYDIFQFTQLQLTMARILQVEPGPYIHRPGSLHVYERDWAKAHDVHRPTKPAQRLYGFGHDDTDSMMKAMERAYYIVQGYDIEKETPTEQWFRHALAPFHEPNPTSVDA